MSCRVTTSVSIPVTSVMLVTRREPSLSAHTLHQNLHRGCNLMANRGQLHIRIPQRHHYFQARNGVSRAIGVNGGEGTVVAGVHGL